MADENTAQVAADESQQVPAEEQQPEEQRELTASEIAAQMGWRPKEEWQGDPEAWKPAEKFILDGRDINQSLSRELKSVREEVSRIGSTNAQILADKLAEKEAEWKARVAQATEEGDTAAVFKLADERPAASTPANRVDPAVERWKAANPWFESHPRAKALAAKITVDLAAQGYDTETQLREAEAEVRERYPQLFKPPAKDPPATQTAASRNPNPSNRVKGFADMPQDAQAAALEMERLNGVKKDDYAKYYWQNETKRKVKA